MSERLRVTIVYEDAGEGWIMASVPEVPGTITQGRTREEARGNVIDALKLMLAGDHPAPAGSDSLELLLVDS